VSEETRQHLVETCARTMADLAAMDEVKSALAIVAMVDSVLPDTEAAARAVVSDVPGEMIALVLYRETEAVAQIALPPIRALALAAQLIEAAMPRLGESGKC
jgi:hypothetical protein